MVACEMLSWSDVPSQFTQICIRSLKRVKYNNGFTVFVCVGPLDLHEPSSFFVARHECACVWRLLFPKRSFAGIANLCNPPVVVSTTVIFHQYRVFEC